jgi:asparagine synthase (glutamine-hydrolysing)
MFSVPNEVRYEDKNSMAFSVESRVPLLDHKLVEYVLKLPIDQKIKSVLLQVNFNKGIPGVSLFMEIFAAGTTWFG